MSADFAMFQQLLDNQANHKEEGVVAEFYDKAIKTGDFNENGLPKFKNVMYVRIRIRDNPDIFDQPAEEQHQRRFPIEYQRYLLDKKESEKGTPLTQFAFLSSAQLECCRYRGIFTVERLAELSDEQAKDLGLSAEKELAGKFLSVSKNNSAIADFAKKEKAYKAEIKKLKEEIAELKAQKGGKNAV